MRRVLDFAEIDKPIAAIDDQIHLRTLLLPVTPTGPRADRRQHTGYTHRLAYLVDMLQAHPLKGQSGPDVLLGRVQRFRPVPLFVTIARRGELQVEKREIVALRV